jgi:hypothetical protein
MSVKYSKTRTLTKRVPTIVDFSEKIQRWDSDNLYAQRAQELEKRSYTLKSVLDRVSDFVNGEGFADDALGKMLVNNSVKGGQSWNAILKKLSKPVAGWRAFVLHIGYDLNYKCCAAELKPIEQFRFGLPDSSGEVKHIYHSLNWEQDARKTISGNRTVECYDTFNPDPDAVALQIYNAGGIHKYKGQIWFVTENEDQYPLATYDPVWEHAEAQAECATAKVAGIRNGFGGTIAIVYPGEFATEAERQQFEDYIEGKSGAEGTNSRIGIQDKSGTRKASEMFQQLQPVNTDKMWEYTETSAAAAIMENYAMPKELIGVRPETGMFNQDNMVQAYVYFNSITRNQRAWVSEKIAFLMQFWATPLITDAAIKEQQYIVNGQPALPAGAPAPTPGPTAQVNENIKNMTGRQRQQFHRILKDHRNKKTTKQQAAGELMQGFGLTEADINLWLENQEEEVAPAQIV